MGTLGALLGPGDRVLEDRLNHASLLDGGWISRADFACATATATRRTSPTSSASGGEAQGLALVASDGTFSMDGDLCPLPELVAVTRAHGAWLMIDEAHGLGVLGRGGRGLVDAERYSTADVPVLVGTLGKAFGTFGAFVAGDEDLVELLIQRARNYIYTTALPAVVAEATLASLGIVEAEEWRRERLRELVARFRAGAARPRPRRSALGDADPAGAPRRPGRARSPSARRWRKRACWSRPSGRRRCRSAPRGCG